MSQFSTITKVLVLPGVTAVGDGWSLLVGLVVDEERIAWSECRYDRSSGEPDFGQENGMWLFEERIIPFLTGRRLVEVGNLMAELDEMRWEVEVIRPITDETPPPKLSRRELFSNLVNPNQEIREVVERPLPPALRLGVSLALVKGAAMVENRSVVEMLADLYSLERSPEPVPVHLEYDGLPNPNDPSLARIGAASYGLKIEAGEALKVLGNDGVRFQNRVRQLKNRVVGPGAEGNGQTGPKPGFLFDLGGGYGRLYDNNSGRILGAIEGLERTVEGCGLGLVDPFLMDDWLTQLAKMKQLQNFLNIRKMRTTLLMRQGVETAEIVQTLADNECCGGVLLDMARLGTLHRTIELARAAQARGLMVVLAGVEGETAVQVALALNPRLLVVGVEEVSGVMDEMNKVLAWVRVKK